MTEWRRACGNSTCLEVMIWEDLVVLRNSTSPHHKIVCSRQEWEQFKAGILDGQFDEAAP